MARANGRHPRPDRRGHAPAAPGPGAAPPGPLRLQTAQDVIDLLQEQVSLVRADPDAGAVEKARAVGALAGVALRAIEAGHLAARLEALEAALKHRAEDTPEGHP